MISNDFKCDYPCTDVNKKIIFPKIKINPEKIKLVMISEAPPKNHSDYYYESNSGSFLQTTKTAFSDAGITIYNYEDLQIWESI